MKKYLINDNIDNKCFDIELKRRIDIDITKNNDFEREFIVEESDFIII